MPRSTIRHLRVSVLISLELAATNVFVREGEGWKLMHHQAGLIARPDDDDDDDDDDSGSGRLLN